MNILAIGAHSEDVELGCGGLLIKAVRHGHRVYVHVLSNGSASGDPKQRIQQATESAKLMGATGLRISDFEETKMTVGIELIREIESCINTVDPDLILTHFKGDADHDHVAVAGATLEAGRFNSNILSYELPVSQGFVPKAHYDISDVIDKKLEVVKVFSSQRGKLFNGGNAIRSLAEYRATQSGLSARVSYIEAFDVVRLCLDKEFVLHKVAYKGNELRDELIESPIKVPQLA